MADKIYDVYHQEIELTSEQEACLKYTGNRTLMVKGYAGAGKSLVLMALAQKYLEKYGRDAKNKVGIFTFQNTLVSTMQEFLHVNGHPEDGVVVSTINSYIKSIYDLLVQAGAAPRRKYPFNNKAGAELRLTNVKRALSEHQTKYGKHRFHDVDPSFWVDEFDWMKEMNVWTDDLDYYLTLPRRGRGSKIRMSASDRVTAYQIYNFYCKYLDRTGQGDWADQTLFIVRHPELIPEKMKFEHVLIDEAQDLSMAQMTAIMRLYTKDMMVAMDMNQKIHNRHWTPKLLGIDTTTKKLTKSMRTTKQIEALAESLRSRNDDNLSDDDKSLRAIPERDGKLPKIVHLEDQAAERKYVVNLVKAYQKENAKLTIGIIAAKNSQIKTYSDWLTSAGIQHEQVTKDSTFSMAKPGVKVVTAYGAKGLEFNCVIIPMFAEGYFPFKYMTDDPEAMADFIVKMRNLVYVSMTRAKNLLTITYWGKGGSRFLQEMNPMLYEWEGPPLVPVKIPPIMPVKVSPQVTKQVTGNSGSNSGAVAASSSVVQDKGTLTDFLKGKGLEVIDKRGNGGALWVVGDKSIDPVLKETRQKFGSLWTFSAKGGYATKHRSGWFTKSTK